MLTKKQEKAEALNAKGTPAVVGTLGEWSTVEPALEGISTVFLVTSPAADMLDLHKGVIGLAVKNGVKNIDVSIVKKRSCCASDRAIVLDARASLLVLYLLLLYREQQKLYFKQIQHLD